MRRLRAYADELSELPEVREIVLIGSLARGDWSARSDADVVIVVDSSDEPGPFRGPRYAPHTRMGIAVDVLVFTPEETTQWGPRFRQEVERGIPLHPPPA